MIWSTGAYPPGCTQRYVDEASPGYWDDDEQEYWESADEYDPEPEDMTEDDWRYWLEVVAR